VRARRTRGKVEAPSEAGESRALIMPDVVVVVCLHCWHPPDFVPLRRREE
jgi:hypothetical protein